MSFPTFYSRVRSVTTTTGTGTVTLGSTPTGFQGFSVVGDGNLLRYTMEDGTNWECGYGVYTASGTTLSRLEVTASSNSGSLVDFPAGTKNVFMDFPPELANSLALPVVPPGRIYAATNTPVSTSDITAATNLYYGPAGNGIRLDLWNGRRWKGFELSQISLAIPSPGAYPAYYDAFLKIDSGSPALHFIQWTNATTRATAIAMLDGLWCTTGDRTYLYVGSFVATAAGQTEDSSAKRFVWNTYNRVPYEDYVAETTDNYSTSGNGTWQGMRAGAANWKREFIRGINDRAVLARAVVFAGTGYCYAVAIDSTTTLDRTKSTAGGNTIASQILNGVAFFNDWPVAGAHYVNGIETSYTASSATAYGDNGGAVGSSSISIQTGFIVAGWR